MKSTLCGFAVLLVLSTMAATAAPIDVDLEGADGAKLKATYTSPGRPGPGMLLIHQCNMDRSSWSALTADLTAAGIHVLTMDLRGFGDSEGEPFSRETFGPLMQKSPADLDTALEFLASQDGVDATRLGVGGASCGAMLTADLASRNAGITTLMVLSGPPSEAAAAFMAKTPGLAVFGAATDGDQVVPGVGDTIRAAVEGSPNESSTVRILTGTEHGLPMFDKNPDLKPELVSWLTTRLLGSK